MRPILLSAVVLAILPAAARAQPAVSAAAELVTSLVWHDMGPSPDTRITAVAGVPSQPFVLFAGVEGSGLWTTSDRGRSWTPLLPQSSPAIRAIAVTAADTRFVYLSLEDTNGYSIGRYDRDTGQVQDIGPPRATGHRDSPTAVPLVTSGDGRTLYAGTRAVWWTTTGGTTWTEADPSLFDAASAASSGGTISAIAPSPVDGRVIWAGTDRGWVHLTRDGGATWAHVSGTVVAAGSAIAAIEASRFDPGTAYVVVVPRDGTAAASTVLRTRNGGAEWVDITNGLPARTYAVREDLARRGLLIAATSEAVFLSFDDGDSWSPLGRALPAVEVRDVLVRDGDLLAASAAHGIWRLDEVAPLRQLTPDVASANVFLFRPPPAWRSAGVENTAVLTYLAGPHGSDRPVTLEILSGTTGDVVRRWTVIGSPGLHRVTWDLRHEPPSDLLETPGVFALPGIYQVRLTVGDESMRQALTVRLDPSVRSSTADLDAQFSLSREVAEMLGRLAAAGHDRSVEAADLAAVLRALQQSDTRPTAALDETARAALARAAGRIGER